MTTPSLSAQVSPKNEPAQGGQAGWAGKRMIVPQDIPIDEAGRLLVSEKVSNNIARGTVQRSALTGQVQIVFTLKDDSRYIDAPSRAQLAADWMSQNRVLDRAGFFSGYAMAGNSANLHHRALLELSKRGLIVREGNLWIWVGDPA